MRLCPCCSGKTYQECCLPYHRGKEAPDAEKLMRSRYSAYAVGNIDYIIRTADRNNPIPIPTRRKQIKLFCESTRFEKLEILDFQPGENEAFVTFHAHLSNGGKDASFIEKSYFKKENGKWLYIYASK